jgi:transposase
MVFSRKLTRHKLLDFFAGQPACVVALEACGGAHHWARELLAMGHDVRLIPPAYVKPFVKRNKNDAIDAEAICEAAQRPGMRFVAVKSEEQQAAGLVFRTRDLAVRQRTQLINAIRGHLAEYGWVAPRGTAHMAMMADLLEEEEMTSTLPEAAQPMFKLMIGMLADLNRQISVLDREIARRAKEDEAARRLMTIPGIGPVAALLFWRLRRRSRRSERAATLRPGSGLHRVSTRPAANSGSAAYRRWVSARSGGY